MSVLFDIIVLYRRTQHMFYFQLQVWQSKESFTLKRSRLVKLTNKWTKNWQSDQNFPSAQNKLSLFIQYNHGNLIDQYFLRPAPQRYTLCKLGTNQICIVRPTVRWNTRIRALHPKVCLFITFIYVCRCRASRWLSINEYYFYEINSLYALLLDVGFLCVGHKNLVRVSECKTWRVFQRLWNFLDIQVSLYFTISERYCY